MEPLACNRINVKSLTVPHRIERILHNAFHKGGSPFNRYFDFARKPLDQIPVIDFQQRRKFKKLRFAHPVQRRVGEMPEDQVHLFNAPMPCAKLQFAPQMIELGFGESVCHNVWPVLISKSL
jgi:hypothetical protein